MGVGVAVYRGARTVENLLNGLDGKELIVGGDNDAFFWGCSWSIH